MTEIKDLCVRYEDKEVIKGLSLTIGDGITCLTGPSGCGKTTLLRVIAGLMEPDGGEIIGKPQKPVFMFQENRLLPWRSVRENVELVIRRRSSEGPEGAAGTAADRAQHMLELVGLGDVGEKMPAELSGGMQRRVALARAMAADGDMLILDEPFTGLDPALIDRMMELIRQVKVPVVMTSHDEAVKGLPFIHTVSPWDI